ncbi:MAG: hypothetical protein CMF26_06390 [Kiloniella sp.]|nr:hypothetical protein [Kiloniella sp.]
MQPLTFILIWVIVWWMIWFAVLSFGLRPETTDPETGAPEHPALLKKALWVTLGSLLLTALFVWLLGLFGPQLRAMLES